MPHKGHLHLKQWYQLWYGHKCTKIYNKVIDMFRTYHQEPVRRQGSNLPVLGFPMASSPSRETSKDMLPWWCHQDIPSRPTTSSSSWDRGPSRSKSNFINMSWPAISIKVLIEAFWIKVEPVCTLIVHELAPLLAHDDHDANNMKACFQKLQST
jgi:hypothetical protein